MENNFRNITITQPRRKGMATGIIKSSLIPISSGGTGATTAPLARENLGLSQFTEMRSFATDATKTSFTISFPSTLNFCILYSDQYGRVALLAHVNGAAATVAEIASTFVSKSMSTTSINIKVGAFNRASFIITSLSLPDVSIVVSA